MFYKTENKELQSKYIEYYKTAFDEAEQHVKTTLQDTAKKHAYEYVYNDKRIESFEKRMELNVKLEETKKKISILMEKLFYE